MTSIVDSTAGTIDRDVPCAGCGYNLRGLTCDGQCPECAKGIGASLAQSAVEASGRLCNADPKWLRVLLTGMWLLLASAGCWFLVGLMLFLNKGTDRSFAFYKLIAVPAVAAWVLTVLGTIRVTSAPPAFHDNPCDRICRRIARLSLIGTVLLPLSWLIFHDDLGWQKIAVIPLYIGLFSAVLSTASFYQHLRNLAMRLPSTWLVIQLQLVGAFCGFIALSTQFNADDILGALADVPTPHLAVPLLWFRYAATDYGFQVLLVPPWAIYFFTPVIATFTLAWFTVRLARAYRIAKHRIAGRPPDAC